MMFVPVLFAFLFVILIFVASYYNSFIGKRNLVKESWSMVDVKLKMRYDLINNIISMLKKYLQHEKNLLIDLTQLRTQAISHQSPHDKNIIENQLTDKIAQVLINVEAYPEIKSSEQFISLMNSLNEVENQIKLARVYYNGTVRNYNSAIQMFPGFLFAKLFNFKEFEFFEVESIEERKNVLINYDL